MHQVFALIVPLFAVIALGHLAARRSFLDANASAVLNGFAYWVALPSLLFVSMARIQGEGLFSVALNLSRMLHSNIHALDHRKYNCF